MKSKKNKSDSAIGAALHRPSDTQREIKNFMRALSSYPERFAHNPYLSFEQHLVSIAASPNLTAEGSR